MSTASHVTAVIPLFHSAKFVHGKWIFIPEIIALQLAVLLFATFRHLHTTSLRYGLFV